MSESENAADEKVTAAPQTKIKKKTGASPKPETTMATLQKVLAEMNKLRQRAIILDTLASACIELFVQTDHQEPKRFFIQQPNGSTAVANLDLVLEMNNELILAA